MQLCLDSFGSGCQWMTPALPKRQKKHCFSWLLRWTLPMENKIEGQKCANPCGCSAVFVFVLCFGLALCYSVRFSCVCVCAGGSWSNTFPRTSRMLNVLTEHRRVCAVALLDEKKKSSLFGHMLSASVSCDSASMQSTRELSVIVSNSWLTDSAWAC